jgi:hypothetical protein
VCFGFFFLLVGFVAEATRPQSPLAPETIFRPAHDWNTMPLMYSTLTDIRSRSSIKANDGTPLLSPHSGGDLRFRAHQFPRITSHSETISGRSPKAVFAYLPTSQHSGSIYTARL